MRIQEHITALLHYVCWLYKQAWAETKQTCWEPLRERFRTFRLIFLLMRGDAEFFRFVWRFQELRNAAFWETAKTAVESVKGDRLLNKVAQSEPKTSFCPRCGQIPDGDRRMDDARELAAKNLWKVPVKRSELDFALAYWYFMKKN